jgi:hypothetical protein
MRNESTEVEPGRSGSSGGSRAMLPLAVLAVVVAACTTLGAATVRLNVGDPTLGEVQHRATVTSVTQRSITVQGIIATPNPCYALAGARLALAGTLELTIAARPAPAADQVCVQAIAQIPYSAVTEAGASGSLRVRVLHTFPDGTLPSTTALDTTVVVP